MSDKYIDIQVLSSLSKVFPTKEPPLPDYTGNNSIFKNEIYSFQVAYRVNGGQGESLFTRAMCPGSGTVRVRTVGLVPSELPSYEEYDDNYITVEPGLFPDVLMDLEESGRIVAHTGGRWRALWIDFIPDTGSEPGIYEISVIFYNKDGEELAHVSSNVRLIDACLPPQKLIHTEWFHSDCISNFYGLEPLSEPHWELIEKFMETAAANGINMILTPVFTPPLDTEVGGERPTIQLVDVCLKCGEYSFDFSKLGRWIKMCLKAGIEYFEISHLFTQWGVQHAPKIMAHADGEYRRIFGWETDSDSSEYINFLNNFLPQLVIFLNSLGVSEKSFFHVSDEPWKEHMESYKTARSIILPHLKGFKMIDALSVTEFYKAGLIERPVASIDHIEPFLELNVPHLWAYYCCGQYMKVSNRFMAMPSSRNRIIGFQLYKYNIEGFLHWGYNFWNTQYSRKQINPFYTTDAGCAFPSGDAFLVYPGVCGPLESIRLKVFSQALSDLRAMQLLESLAGRDAVMNIIEGQLPESITFSQYPRSAEYILRTREVINEAICRAIAKCP